VIIHHPEIVLSQGEVTISAKVEFDQVGTNTPDNLWIKFPEKYAKWISPRGDGFLCSLLLIGMYYQEDIEVRGEVSPLLAYNIPVVIKLYHQVWPTLFKQIDVRFSSIKSFESNQGDHWGVGTAFSGGVDSSFTLWSHLPGNQSIPSALITHGLFLHGFDILLSQPDYYDRLRKLYTDLFQRLNLELITASTNIYSFYEFRVDWAVAYCPPLIGAAMHLGRLLNRFYVPSSRSAINDISSGLPVITLSTVHLLSTENLKSILHNPAFAREEKIDRIRSWPEIQGTLRVCAELIKPVEHINCSFCAKCLNLMAYLEIVGDLHKFASFHKPFRPIYFFRWLWKSREAFVRANSILRFSRQYKRWDIWFFLLLVYIPGYVKFRCVRIYLVLLGRIPAHIKYAIKSRVFRKNV
jgi:hypothetical protein